jgi:hypothetical protein
LILSHLVRGSKGLSLKPARKYKVGLVLAHQNLGQSDTRNRAISGKIVAKSVAFPCFRMLRRNSGQAQRGISRASSGVFAETPPAGSQRPACVSHHAPASLRSSPIRFVSHPHSAGLTFTWGKSIVHPRRQPARNRSSASISFAVVIMPDSSALYRRPHRAW